MAYEDGSRSWAYSVREHRVSASLVGLAAIIMLVATLLPRGTASAAASGPPAILFPANGAYFGSWVAPRSGESTQQAIQRAESEVGRKFAIDHQYYKWDTQFPTSEQTWTVAQGRIPFINWKPQRTNGTSVSWASIASGAEDAAIIARADAIKAFGYPMYLAFHHEPEDDLATFGTPEDYAAAFRHIVTVFRARGVTNVAFVWTMMSWSFNAYSGKNVDSYYPGDAYVDAIGSDGYDWYPMKSGAKWDSFQTVYQATHDFAVAHGNKPVIAVEYGVQEDPAQPGRKAQWLHDVLGTISGWPEFKALIYFDEVKDGYPWIIDSSASSVAAYAALGQSSYLNPTVGSSPNPAPSPSPSPAPSPSPSQAPSSSSSPSPSQSPSPSSIPVPTNGLANTFNGGLKGVSLAAGLGSSSGSSFDTVSATSGGSVTYDTTHTRGVGVSVQHVAAAGSNAYYEWNRSFGTQAKWYGRVYVWFDSLPTGDVRLVRAKGGNMLRFAIDVMHGGQLRLKDASNQTIGVTRTSILTGGWVRIEWGVNQVTGQVEVRFFNSPNVTTPTETIVSGTGLNIGSSTDTVQIGRSGTQAFSAAFWTDDPAIATSGFIGPVA